MNPHEAVQNYLDACQEVLSCIIKHPVIDIRGGYRPGMSHPLLVIDGESGDASVALSGTYPVLLSIRQLYRLEQSGEGGRRRDAWDVRITAYDYALLTTDGVEILTYHWHPLRPELVVYPHLHLSAGAQVRSPILNSKVHIPTGHVCVADVVRFAIVELGVQTFRQHWQAILASANATS